MDTSCDVVHSFSFNLMFSINCLVFSVFCFSRKGFRILTSSITKLHVKGPLLDAIGLNVLSFSTAENLQLCYCSHYVSVCIVVALVNIC